MENKCIWCEREAGSDKLCCELCSKDPTIEQLANLIGTAIFIANDRVDKQECCSRILSAAEYMGKMVNIDTNKVLDAIAERSQIEASRYREEGK